jgi:phosphatidylglycerophosphatase A
MTGSNGDSRRRGSDELLLAVGSLGYIGFVRYASGTISVAVVGVPAYLAAKLGWGISNSMYAALVAAFTLLAVWIAGRADDILGEKDSRRSVIDELPGFWIALIALPCTWQIVTGAFFIERALDIMKIWPASWIEKRVAGGWGVVLDDVVAGLYTLAILHAAATWLPARMGIAPS